MNRKFDAEYWTRENYFILANLLGPIYMKKRIERQGLDWSLEPTLGAEIFLEFLQKHRASSVLDVGCGYGRDAVFFAMHGLNVTGIEYSSVACESARGFYLSEKAREARSINSKEKHSWGNIVFINDDFRDWEFIPSSFDAVFSFKTLHQFRHNPPRGLKDPLSSKYFFKLMINHVRPNGLIGISTFSTQDHNYGKGLYIEEDTFDTRGYRPCAFYSEERFTGLFTDCKLIHSEHLRFTEKHAPDGEHTHGMWFGVAIAKSFL